MVGISWQDKELVTLLSTAANSWAPNVTVLRRKRGRAGEQVLPSTPVHIQYQENMRGLDITDMLWQMYSCQGPWHKWWKKILGFVLDQSITNCYIIHKEQYVEYGLPLLIHMDFHLSIAMKLIEPSLRPVTRAPRRRGRGAQIPCGPQRCSRCRACVVCGKVQAMYCPGCEYKFMCSLGDCYIWHHNQYCY
jgi:hypothetical protein